MKKFLTFLLLIFSISAHAELVTIGNIQFDHSINDSGSGVWDSYPITENGHSFMVVERLFQLMYYSNESFKKNSHTGEALTQNAIEKCKKIGDAYYAENVGSNPDDTTLLNTEINHTGFLIGANSGEFTNGGNFHCIVTIKVKR